MTTHLGIDIGNGAIKVACAQGEGTVRPLTWKLGKEREVDYMPCAIQLDAKSHGVSTGWSAWQAQRDSNKRVATCFRDRLRTIHDSMMVGDQSVGALAIWKPLLSRLWEDFQRRDGALASVTVALPDDWNGNGLAMPMAFAKLGLQPTLFVREWCAILARQVELDSDYLLLISAGRSATRISVCAYGGQTWSLVATASSSAISGIAVRQRVIHRLAEETVLAMRRDPRDDPVADPALRLGVDRAIAELYRGDRARVRTTLFGREFQHELSRAELATECGHLRASLLELTETMLASLPQRIASIPIVVWGELAGLLPIATWVNGFCPKDSIPRVASLHDVAEGAVLLGATALREGLEFASAIDLERGSVLSIVVPTQSAGHLVPLCDEMPGSLIGLTYVGAAELIQVGATGEVERRPIDKHVYRLGRDVRSDWSFDEVAFTGVSAAHAVIYRDGALFRIRDLDSSNGTFVNGRQLSDHVLQHRDLIRLGSNGPRLRFELLKIEDCDGKQNESLEKDGP